MRNVYRVPRNSRANRIEFIAIAAGAIAFGGIMGFGFGTTVKPVPAQAVVQIAPPDEDLGPAPSMDELQARWAPKSYPTTSPRAHIVLGAVTYAKRDHGHNGLEYPRDHRRPH